MTGPPINYYILSPNSRYVSHVFLCDSSAPIHDISHILLGPSDWGPGVLLLGYRPIDVSRLWWAP